MKDIKIEKANAKDISTLAYIEAQHETAPGWGSSGIKSELEQNNSCILKAHMGGKIIGFISGKIIPPELQIINLAVEQNYVRQSVATKLLCALIAESQKTGCTKTTLEVNEKNIPAFKLYSNVGFKVVGKRPKFYNNTYTALLMDKC